MKRILFLAGLAALCACKRADDGAQLARLDRQILAAAKTPKLAERIVVDPAALGQKAPQPTKAAAPAPEGDPRECLTGGFASDPKYGGGLPAALAPYAGGKLTDVAGYDGAHCRGRGVTFTASEAPERLLAWYRERLGKGGYSVSARGQGSDSVLTGRKGAAAYYVIVSPQAGGGAEVALVSGERI
jgi:hypothetical protein